MAREIGISNITLFEIENETPAAVQYGQAMPVKWAVSLESTINYSESAYYADNIQEFSNKMITGIDLSLEMSSNISPDVDAKITGKHYADGFAVTHANALPPAYAIAFEVKMDDGNLRRVVYYKTTLTREGQTNETVSDSVTAQTYTYTGKCSALQHNGAFMLMMDKAVIDALPNDQNQQDRALEAWNNFFTTPQKHDIVIP